MSRKPRKSTRGGRDVRPDLFTRVRPYVLEAFFLGAFLVCKRFIDGAGNMPVELAVTFLAAIATETLAARVKLRAVRHRLGDGTLSPLPGSLVPLILFSGLRVAVFGAVVIQAVVTITGEPQSVVTTNLLIALVVAKEVVVLALLRLKPGARVPKKPPLILEVGADLNLVFVSVFSALLIADLLSGPMLDTSWNPLFLGVMVLVCLFLSFLMVAPFKRFAESRPSGLDSNSREQGGGRVTGLVVSAVVSLYIVAPLFYDSAAEGEHMAQALAARPVASEFVYSQPSRLKPAALERLCELSSLSRLELHTKHTGYIPPCVYRIPGLTEIDVRGNDFKRLDVNNAAGLLTLDASHNEFTHIYDLNPLEDSTIQALNLSYNLISEVDVAISRFPALEELDLSHNPLKSLPADQLTGLRRLRVVRLAGTSIPPDQLEALRQKMPWTRFEL